MRYRFGDYLFDTERYELQRTGVLVPLRPKECDILAYLLAHRDRVVATDELLAQVWPGQCVGDVTLHVRMLAVRKAKGMNASGAFCDPDDAVAGTSLCGGNLRHCGHSPHTAGPARRGPCAR
jgi:hypothetical protein